MAFSGSEKKRFDRAKRNGSSRVLNIATDLDGHYIAELRITDFIEKAPPIRKRLIDALGENYEIRQDEGTRIFSLEKRRLE